MNMDTHEDYGVILERLKTINIPNRQEAWALLKIHQQDHPRALGHAQAVAFVASAIARALNRVGHGVNVPLVWTAGILHDIAKGQTDHAKSLALF
jgi:HD superfamily phosphodiesterase